FKSGRRLHTSLRALRLDFALRAHRLRGCAPAARASSLPGDFARRELGKQGREKGQVPRREGGSSWHGSREKTDWEGRVGGKERTMGLILLIVLIVLLLGAVPSWPYSRGWGYWPSGTLGLIVLIVVILLLTGNL